MLHGAIFTEIQTNTYLSRVAYTWIWHWLNDAGIFNWNWWVTSWTYHSKTKLKLHFLNCRRSDVGSFSDLFIHFASSFATSSFHTFGSISILNCTSILILAENYEISFHIRHIGMRLMPNILIWTSSETNSKYHTKEQEQLCTTTNEYVCRWIKHCIFVHIECRVFFSSRSLKYQMPNTSVCNDAI